MAKNLSKGGMDKYLQEVIRRDANGLNLIKLYAEMLFTSNEKVTLTYTNENSTESTYDVPSMAYLLSAIARIEKNFDNLSGIGILESSIIMPDGTRRIILAQNTPQEPKTVVINASTVANAFDIEQYDVYQNLVTPKAFIPVNLKPYFNKNVKSAIVRKVVVDETNEAKLDYFNNYIKINSYKYNDLKAVLDEQSINYKEIDYNIEVTPKMLKYSGDFDVISYRKSTASDNQALTVGTMLYRIDSTSYTENNTGTKQSLKIGDQITVNDTSGNKSTVYKVTFIDYGLFEIAVQRVEGLDAIKIGIGTLSILGMYDEDIKAKIPINIDEIFAPFIKIVTNESLVSSNWGESKFIVTNSLVKDKMSFSDYFRDNISDIKNGIKYLAAVNHTNLEDYITPNTPSLLVSNFNVGVINKHKQEQLESQVKEKYAEKEKLKTEISSVDASITNLKGKLFVETYDISRSKIEKQIDDAYTKRKNLTENYKSIVSDLLATINTNGTFSPKYAIRGFFDIPNDVYTDKVNKIGAQGIIKFECEYRYLSVNKTSTNTQSTSYIDKNGDKINATSTDWNRLLDLPQRFKMFNKATGKSEWQNVVESNADEMSINEVMIPITENEAVEIRVRSISEVGYPLYSVTSDWSESVVVEFPSDLVKNNQSIIQELSSDNFLSTLFQELSSIGLYEHLKDSSSSADQKFNHAAENISMNYFTPENKKMSVEQVVASMKEDISSIKANYLTQIGDIEVYIEDSNGNIITTIENESSIQIQAPYYKDQVEQLTDKKGKIVDDVYYLVIKNKTNYDTNLLSFVPGHFNKFLPVQDYNGYIRNASEYNQYRKYFLSPIGYSHYTQTDKDYIDFKNSNPNLELPEYASMQAFGQLLYQRYMDFSLSEPLYTPDDYNFLKLDGGENSEDFIWDGTFGLSTLFAPNGGGKATSFAAHKLHPALGGNSDIPLAPNDYRNIRTYVDVNGNKVYDNDALGLNIPRYLKYNNNFIYPMFYQTILASKKFGETNYYKQKQFSQKANFSENNSLTRISELPQKNGFVEWDKYLIGSDTCGAYLKIFPQINRSLYVGSQMYNKGLTLNNSLVRIPILFQTRMTDFWGSGNDGSGNIGGIGGIGNVTYSKKIGIDIAQKNIEDLFSFDISFTKSYQK